MRKKTLLDYTVLALFIMCMGLALYATLQYSTRAQQREYLLQAEWLLKTLAITLGLYILMRVEGKLAPDIPAWGRGLIEAIVVVGAWGLGLYARLAVIRAIPLEPASDFATYYNIAEHLVNGTLMGRAADGYRDYIAQFPHTLGFPMLVLAPAFEAFGISVSSALNANLMYSMGSILCAYLIARRAGGRAAGMIAAVLMSLWPSHVFYSTMVASEPAFTFYILLATYLLMMGMMRDEGSLYRKAPSLAVVLLLAGGICLGIAGGIRPMAIVLVAALAVVMLGINRPLESRTQGAPRHVLNRGWLCLIVMLVGYFATNFVITQRVSEEIGRKPASGLSASGYNLMVGVNVDSQGLWNAEDAAFFSNAFAQTGSANAAHELCMQEALKRLQEAPEDVLNLLVYKFEDLWRTDDFGIDWNLLWAGQQGILTEGLTATLESFRPAGRSLYLWILLLCMLGAMRNLRRARKIPFIFHVGVLFFLGTALLHMLLETQVRYHYNMLPYFMLMASMTLSGWRREVKEEPPERVVVKMISEDILQKENDHTHFDVDTAIRDGHIIVSASEGYRDEAKKESEAEKERK